MSSSASIDNNNCSHCILGNAPINETPIRIALLGGPKVGKTSIASKLSLGHHRETYYPTHSICPELFSFIANDMTSRVILDESNEKGNFERLVKLKNVELSPAIYKHYFKGLNVEGPRKPGQTVGDSFIQSRNEFYMTYYDRRELGSDNAIPPHVTPILVELVDTPPYNPDQVVPFLESSLYNKLGPEYLRNLANEPRRPVLTNPILVASGASELNGTIDGYFFVYNPIPELEIPSYDEAVSQLHDLGLTPLGVDSESTAAARHLSVENHSFKLLNSIKASLDEAWLEYVSFKTLWEKGEESDKYSMKLALKSIWKERGQLDTKKTLDSQNINPFKLNALPPIWIICTNRQNPMAHPALIQSGRELAKSWGCGFISIDCRNDDLNFCLSLIIKEIIERKKNGGFKKYK